LVTHADRLMRQIPEARVAPSAAWVISEFAFGEEGGWVELQNRDRRPRSPRGLALATKTQTGNWLYRLASQVAIDPGKWFVVTVPRRPDNPNRVEDAEHRERWRQEKQNRVNGNQRFPGFDAAGGFLALIEPSSESPPGPEGDGPYEAVLDFFFYGPQASGTAYGRLEDGGFGWLEPTPGSANKD